jgi:triacylglycerol esterase/lipase EstA (alpha/beta hydrolase family)
MFRVKYLAGALAVAAAMVASGAATASAALPGPFGSTGASTASAALPVPYGSTALNDFLNAELFNPTTLAGANNGCKPTSTHPYPVVLVHGTAEDEGSNWVTLSPLLANAGYCVYAFNYGETSMSMGDHFDALGEIAASAGQLSTFVDQVLSETGASKVDIVGHSLGGMMPNYYIKFLGGASKVNTLIGLAPSNHGTTMSGLTTMLANLPFASMLESIIEQSAPSLLEQALGSTFMANLFAGADTVAGPRYVVIESTHDEIVTPYTNAFLSGPNVTNITIQDQCPADPTEHIGMDWDSPSLQNVLNQLSNTPNPAFTATCTNYGWTL